MEGASGRLIYFQPDNSGNFAIFAAIRRFWHADCLVAGMSDENYSLLLLQIVCLLMFFYGVAVLSQNPEWFDGRRGQPPSVDHILAMWRRSHAKTADETILKQ